MIEYETVPFRVWSHDISPAENPALNNDPTQGLPLPISPIGTRIVIRNSSELIQLSNIGDIRVIEELVKLLDVPGQGWAAQVLIWKMMGRPNVSSTAEKWWQAEGQIGKAKKDWAAYIQKVKPSMRWNKERQYFRYVTPSGRVMD
jgi:hypothetical protein